MKFAIWQSVNYADCALGYKPGALMRQVWTGTAETWWYGASLEDVLDPIWRQFQRVEEGDMPSPEYDGVRSLSIGDVVQLVAEDDDAVETWWTPKFGVGWEEVDPIDEMRCPDCGREWPIEVTRCPYCSLTMEQIAERLVRG